MRSPIKPILATTACLMTVFASSHALAVPQGAFWVEIPVVDSPDDAVDMTGYRTFLLYVVLEPDDIAFAADFGIASPNAGISTTQTVFQHPAGSDIQSTELIQSFVPDVFYDTHIALGDADGQNGEVEVIGPINWDPAGFNGAWFATFPVPGSAGPGGGPIQQLPLENAFWMAQITISSSGEFGQSLTAAGEFIGGQLFLSGTGPSGTWCGDGAPSCGVADVPNVGPLSGLGPLPGAFQMLTPVCGATNIPPHNAVLEWESHPTATEYDVVVTSDFRLLNGVHGQTGVTGTTHTIPAGALAPCATYYWYVRAWDVNENTRLADNWQLCSFTTSILGDTSSDGVVDTADLSRVIANFGQTCN